MGTDYTTPLPANGDYRTYCEDAVKGPGKFEGEPGYTFYFYESMMEGDGEDYYELDADTYTMGEEYETSYTAFDITGADTAIFPELKGYKRAFLHEDDYGFVTCTLSETGTL
tara:strand:+ start:361 stop:696 length:336 start_codon:yes stop_codon:yes gene_type:complete